MAEGTAGAPLLAAEGEAREDKKPQSASGFGGAHIGFFASFCLLVNNITGPGMVQVRATWRRRRGGGVAANCRVANAS